MMRRLHRSPIDRGFFGGLRLVRLHVDVNDRPLVNEYYTGSSARYPGIYPVRLHAGVFDRLLVNEYYTGSSAMVALTEALGGL